jgi:phospholipase C
VSRTDTELTLTVALAILLVAAFSASVVVKPTAPGHPTTLVAGTTPILHVVVLMKENHAFDNYFGTFPGVDGIPPGISLPDGHGGNVSPQWIKGSSTPDLPHSRAAELQAYDNGTMDGFAIASHAYGPGLENATMGYYDSRQIPWYWSTARTFTLADHYFQPVFGPTIPNRLYSFAGTAAGLTSNAINASSIDNQTVFDQLRARGISWTYYSSESLPFLPLPEYFAHIRNDPAMAGRIAPTTQLKSDIESGSLAQVVYHDTEFDPFISEHPPENVTVGERWTQDIVQSIEASPIWNSTAIFLTFDEAGGYYDHVPPPQVDRWGYGFRVPMIVISPFAKRANVDSDLMDHTSIMKFIATNWALPILTARESRANDLLAAFAFPPIATQTSPTQLSGLDLVGPVLTGINMALVADSRWRNPYDRGIQR